MFRHDGQDACGRCGDSNAQLDCSALDDCSWVRHELVHRQGAPIFGVAQVMMTLVLIALIVAVVAFWPQRWTSALNRLYRFR